MEGCQGDLGAAIRVIPPMFLMGESLRKFEIRSLDENSIIQKNLASFLALFIDIQKHEVYLYIVQACIQMKNITLKSIINPNIRHLKVQMEAQNKIEQA